MPNVKNWQIGREMPYPYQEVRPRKQFAGVFDTNKCIACQTCTIACKTTWTVGKGQEYMLWNNVETKPYGSYPLGWDVRVLNELGPQEWDGETYKGKTIFEAAPPGERTLGWRPEDLDYANPNVGEDDCVGTVEKGLHLHVPHMNWFFYLARTCMHCTYPACLASCPRKAIYKRPEDGIVLIDQARCRGYRECVRGCPYKKVYYNPMTGTSEKCIGCFPKHDTSGTPQAPQCFLSCIGKIRLAGWLSRPEKAREDIPLDYFVHIRKIALPLYPQFGLEPNMYYIPPIHVPKPFLRQMFGPGVDHAIETYRKIPDDKDLAGLLALFGSTPTMIPRWKRKGDTVFGLDEHGKEIVRVPITEPVHIRVAYDMAQGVVRTNVP